MNNQMCNSDFMEEKLSFVTGDMKLVAKGHFFMGTNDVDAKNNESPMHKVFVDSFYMDMNLVTNQVFNDFCEETGYITVAEKLGEGDTFIDGKWQWVKNANWRQPFGPGSSVSDQPLNPVVLVTQFDALAFCKWRSIKEKRYFRLPTEAEWEKAARGNDQRIYPWGNDEPTENMANYSNGGDKKLMPVGSFIEGASPYGLFDLAGNAWEWCIDAYKENYYSMAPPNDVGGPLTLSGESVFRGGSFLFPKEALVSTGRHENFLSRPSVGIGFRTVLPLNNLNSVLLRIINRKMVHYRHFIKLMIKKRLKAIILTRQ